MIQSLAGISDFFIPRFCLSCNTRLDTSQTLVCDNCKSTFIQTTDDFLKKECKRKFGSGNLISGFYTHLIFEKDSEIQTIIHSLKYGSKFLAGIMLGELIAENAKDKILGWQCDTIIPIPLHPLKKALRGYNQAYFISKGLAKGINIPVVANAVKRIKMTQTQTKLNFLERKNNMQNAFELRKNRSIKNKKIILVDDVITTGATVIECAKILKENGASKIFAVSLASPYNETTFDQEL